MLSADDPLPHRPQRILVAGPSGSDKTTLAAAIGAELQVRHVEIDALFHGPRWTRRPGFETDVRAFASTPRWVTEWQYCSVRELLLERADLLVWLDLGRPVVMAQIVRGPWCAGSATSSCGTATENHRSAPTASRLGGWTVRCVTPGAGQPRSDPAEPRRRTPRLAP